jgi:hypothetical protein
VAELAALLFQTRELLEQEIESIVNDIAEKVEKRLAAFNSFVKLIDSGGDPSQALEERFGATTQDV